MKNNRYILWFCSGMLIGAASGMVAGSRLEKSGAIGRMLSEAEKLESELSERGHAAKKAIVAGAGELSKVIRKNLSRPVPDLYKATESVILSEQSGGYEW